MCGLYGYVGNKSVDLVNAIEPIHHRGPDADGFWIYNRSTGEASREALYAKSIFEKVAFGFKRLAIIDLAEHSNQPLSIDEGYHIIFNGEIYNYLELRGELEAIGEKFHTSSDTEVLLRSYKIWGVKCFERFNGMWAFLIFDEQKDQLIISRDRFGIKPLYYYQDKDGIYFFSEIKQILSNKGFCKKINDAVVRDYLESAVLDAGRETFYKGVFSFPQSHFALVDLKDYFRLDPQPYFDLKSNKTEYSYQEAVEKFKVLFQQAVELRFRSDVPVGACLSGGLDSSSIVSLAGHLNKRITAFSVDNRDKELSEIAYVNDVVNSYKSLSSSVTYNEENDLDLLDNILQIQDEPISGLGVIAQWRVMKLAAENKVTVLLDGQGGDEILGGYRKFLFFYLKELLKKGKIFTFFRELMSFLSDNQFNLFEKEGIRRYLNKTNVSKYLTQRALDTERSHNIGISGASGFAQKSYEDIFHYSYPQLLRYEDRNSMAFSLESRVPFLDYRLVEFVYSLPPSYKVRNGLTKAILRDSMKGILPESVRKRKSKLGFATPEKRWMTNTFRVYFKEYFSAMMNPFINAEKLSRDFNAEKDNIDYKSLLRIYLFDRWYQLHFSGQD